MQFVLEKRFSFQVSPFNYCFYIYLSDRQKGKIRQAYWSDYLFKCLFSDIFKLMSRHTEAIALLLSQGVTSSRQIVQKTGLSQPTVSRALAELGDQVVRIGSGPSIQYALRDGHRGFASAPVYRVSDEGQIRLLGSLVPVRPDGFAMVQEDGLTIHSDDLPWWLLDMRPQGYLGRAYAKAHSGSLRLPANPEHWSDSEVIHALLSHGHDAVGNLLIGELARDRFVGMSAPAPVDRAQDYPSLAQAAASGHLPGSSAGGEQPKFCAYCERGHVLVKFSGAKNNSVSERWRDLLLAEHLALSVLGIESEVFDFDGQRFLEVPRFDRIGPWGRVGIFSLRSLDAQFIGKASANWPTLVSHLASQGHVDRDAIAGASKLWAFGTLIGNTDMHAGNLSFISSHGRPYQLAPAYDMLPMGFAPASSGVITDALAPAALSASIDGKTWREALVLAQEFLAKVRGHDGFSEKFVTCIEALGQHIDEAASRIARIG